MGEVEQGPCWCKDDPRPMTQPISGITCLTAPHLKHNCGVAVKELGIGDAGVTHHTTHYLASPAWLHSPQTQWWCCREGAGHRRCRSDPQPSPDQSSTAWLHSPQTELWCCREGAGHRRCRSDPQPSPDQTLPTRRPQASCRRCCTWTSSAPLHDPRLVAPLPATHLALSLQLKQNSNATSHHCLQHVWYCLYN